MPYSEAKKQYHKGYYLKNKEAKKQYDKEYRSKNKKIKKFKSKEYNLKKCFGLTVEQYDKILLSQNGVCKICKKAETTRECRTGEIRALAVDHDHNTKKVRGLLCKSCNTGLGNFLDDPELLIQASLYLGGKT